jgi:AbrB family looped-hinge helix DNA binding protein
MASKEIGTTLTSEGQVTIPGEIRKYLNLRTGQRVELRIRADGLVVMRPRKHDVRDLKGILRAKGRKPISVEKMNKAIAEGFGKR